MSKSKEKKIKRIKNRKIWPFVVAIVVSVFVFAGISVALLDIGLSNLVMSKGQILYQTIQGVEDSYRECQNSGEEFSVIAKNIYNYSSDVQSICIVDGNNQMLQQYGDQVPDFEEMREESGKIDLSVEDGTQADYLWIDSDVVEVTGQSLQISGDTAYGVYCWYVRQLSDGTQLCVRVLVTIYQYELMSLLVTLILILAIMLLVIGLNIFMIVRVVRGRKREKEILYTSPITGGTNIQYFKDQAAALLKANQRNQFHYAMISIRLAKYHNFCSCYGIKEGEELMENLFGELQKHLQSKEVAAHASKADFALLLKYGEPDNLTYRLERMIGDLKEVRPSQKLNFGAGIYWVPDKYEDISTMYNYVEVVQETIPEDLEDHIRCFDESMLANQRWIRKVEDDMERALDDREFQVYLQPKYSTKEEKLSGAEALVRWIHPTEGFIPPNKFIPIFEQNGFILQLDDYMITEIASMQAKWLHEGKKIVPISVNVSRAHFTKVDLAEHICELVDQFHVPHDMIELELTESAFFDDKDILINTVKQLKGYGFDISMDDFGAGYSSLNSLKELPLDVLKLDAEFFRGEDCQGRGDLIVGEAIALAKKLDMRIVAEGIETREQVDSLAEKNCDLIQGYYFAKPMPVEEFEKLAFGEDA
ncbi:MAG: EAL domain-containing protein [Roseburia sp.]